LLSINIRRRISSIRINLTQHLISEISIYAVEEIVVEEEEGGEVGEDHLMPLQIKIIWRSKFRKPKPIQSMRLNMNIPIGQLN
jgi:hypothetical protein